MSLPMRSVTPRFSGLLACLVVFATGCGLAMNNEDRLDRAEAAYAAGDFRAVVIDAKDVLLDEPNNRRGRLLLGRASARVGDGAAAEKELRRAVQLGVDPQDIAVDLALALLFQGKFQEVLDEVPLDVAESEVEVKAMRLTHADAYMGLRQPERARELYLKVVQSDPADIKARMGMVSSFVADKNFAEARASLDQILEANPDEVGVWLYSGSLQVQLRNFEAAAASFKTALGLVSANGAADQARRQALAGLAEALVEQDRVDDARPHLEQLVAEAPEALQTKLLVARIAYIEEDWKTAQQNLLQIVGAAPDYRPAQVLLGAVQLRGGNLAQAEMYLLAAVAAMPEDIQARQLLAETQLQMEKAGEAEEALAPIVSGEDADPLSLQMAARASLVQGNLDAALEYLRRSVAENPNDADLQFQLATILLQTGRSDEAEALLKGMDVSASQEHAYRRDALQVLQLIRAGQEKAALGAAQQVAEAFADRAAAHNLLGVVKLANRDAGARTSFEQAVRLDKTDIIAQRYLGMIEESAGEFSVAESRYKRLLVDQPNAAWVLFALGRVAEARGERDVAIGWLEKARQADSKALSVRLVLGQFHLAANDTAAASQVLSEALEIDDSNTAVLNLEGLIRYQQGDFERAVDSFRRVVDASPENVEFRLNLARAYGQLGDQERAIGLLQDNIRATLDHLPSGVLLGLLKAQSGELGAAADVASQLRAQYPDNVLTYALEGEIHALGGDLIQAESDYQKAVSMGQMRGHVLRLHDIKRQRDSANADAPLLEYLQRHPLDIGVRLVLADAHMHRNEVGQAIAVYEGVLVDDPTNAIALNNLAWNYFTSDDSRAVQTARRAYEIAPESASIADTYGWILTQEGSVEEGEKLLARAVQLEGVQPEIQYHHAVALAKLGKSDAARDTLKQILGQDEEFPSRGDAQRLVAEL